MRDALTTASEIEDTSNQSEALAKLVPHLPQKLRDQVARDALAAAQEIWAEIKPLEALADSVPYLSGNTREAVIREVLSSFPAIALDDSKVRRILRQIVPYLPGQLLEEAVAEIRATYVPTSQIRILLALARGLPEEQQALVSREVLAVIRGVQEPHQRKRAIEVMWESGFWGLSLVKEKLDEVLDLILDLILEIPVLLLTSRDAFDDILSYFPFILLTKAQLIKVLSTILKVEDSNEREHTLAILAAQMAEIGEVETARSLLYVIESPDHRVRVLAALAPRWPEEKERLSLFKQAWDGIKRALDSIEDRLDALDPFAYAHYVSLGWEQVQKLIQAKALEALVPCLPESLLQDALSIAQGFFFAEGARVEALSALAPRLPEDLLEKIMEETGVGDWQGIFWAKLTPYLPEEKRERFFKMALERVRVASGGGSSHWAAKTLEALAPNLPSCLMSDALEAVQSISGEYQSKALVALIPFLPEGLLFETFRWLRKEEMEHRILFHYERILDVLLPRMAEAGYVEEALEAAQSTKVKSWQVRRLVALALGLPEEQRKPVLEKALAIFDSDIEDLRIENPGIDEDLASIALHIAALGYLKLALKIALSIEKHRMETLVKLVPYLAKEMPREALTIVCAFPADEALTAFAESLLQIPRDQSLQLWSEMLHGLATHSRETLLASLRSLAPLVATLGGPEAIAETFRAIQDVGRWWP